MRNSNRRFLDLHLWAFFLQIIFCKSSGFTCIFPAYALKYPLNSHLGKGVILWLHYWQNYLSGIMKTSRIPAFARHMECSAVSSGFFQPDPVHYQGSGRLFQSFHRHHGGCIQQPVGCSILHHYAGRLQNGGTEAGL